LRIEVRISAGYEFIKDTNNTFANTNWHHVAFVQDGTSPVAYVDGSAEATTDNQSPNDVTAWCDDVGSILDVFAIGMYRDSSPRGPFDGIIDEVRYSNIDRPAEWIKATYETGRDHLLDWGSEETGGTPGGGDGGWEGKVCGVTNPASICGVIAENVASVSGVT
jgi:hypothetical protein